MNLHSGPSAQNTQPFIRRESAFAVGSVPSTFAEHGGRTGVLVLMDEPAFTGCLQQCISARSIDREQAARLAAVLPLPLQQRPDHINHYSGLILQRMHQMGW
jgi:hypothetical protein